MTQPVFVETVFAPFSAFGPDISGFSVSTAAGGTELDVIAGYSGSARIEAFSVGPTLGYAGQTPLGAAFDGFSVVDYGSTTLSLSAFRLGQVLSQAGAAQASSAMTDLNSGLQADLVQLAATTSGNGTVMLSSLPSTPGLATFSVQGSALTLADGNAAPGIGQVSALATASGYGQSWALVTTDTNDLHSYSVDAAGQLTAGGSIGAVNGLGIATPDAIAPFDLGGQPYFIVGSAGSSSLSVLRLEADGSLTPTDHVLDSLDTRFADASSLATASVGTTTFALAAGSDDGASLFRVLPDGTLFHLASLADTAATSMANVSAVALVQDGQNLRMFLASAAEPGISHFAYSLSALGSSQTGSSGTDVLGGSALDDVLWGAGGDDALSGNGGDDILIDGAGSDTLSGGAGRDTFVLVPDGVADAITDFERGADTLDFSRYPLLHDASAISLTSTATGAVLSVQGDSLQIFAADGASLTAADLFASNPFNVDRPPLLVSGNGATAGSGPIQVGGAGDDVLSGTAGNDILTGNGGDDTLAGGAGADSLYGGPGLDVADYGLASSGVVLNLSVPSANTGDAAGDSFFSIEGFRGSAFNDTFTGDGSAQSLWGLGGDDVLDGGGGDDNLLGGDGNDSLFGGAGADLLDGGAGTDTASWGAGSAGLWLDLALDGRNGGDAAGDRLIGVENVQGTALQDVIAGDAGANSLFGNGGGDVLSGGGGSDILDGGAGDDVLAGGAGGQTMVGGAGRDTASYATAKAPVTVDLANPASNAGIATGDSYTSVEDVVGSRFGDSLSGDAADNRLFGGAGNDWLDGRAGADTLVGGAGADTFHFAPGFGTDDITDFAPSADIIELALSLLGSVPADPTAVVAAYGSLAPFGALLDFGNGDVIDIHGVTDLGQLADALAFL